MASARNTAPAPPPQRSIRTTIATLTSERMRRQRVDIAGIDDVGLCDREQDQRHIGAEQPGQSPECQAVGEKKPLRRRVRRRSRARAGKDSAPAACRCRRRAGMSGRLRSLPSRGLVAA